MYNLADTYIETLDYLTPQFRRKMLNFSPQQRKIICILAERQTPENVKTIAQRCFITHQTASGQLRFLLEQNIVTKHQFGRESFFEIEDVQLRHWLDMRAGRIERIEKYVDFVEAFHNTSSSDQKYFQQKQNNPSDKNIINLLRNFDPDKADSKSEQELGKLFEFWFVAQSIFG